MAISKIGKIILVVSDLDRSLSLYRDTLGLRVTGVIPADFAFIDGGGVTLALRQAPAGDTQACHDEVSFLTDDVHAAYADLATKGVQFRYPPRAVTEDDKSQLFATDLRDPDGHILSITSRVATAR